MNELRTWSRGQWALRAVTALGPVLAMLATIPVGTPPPWWSVLLVAALGAAYAYFPDSAVGAGALLVVLIWWGVGPPDGLHPMALVASAAVLASHVAGTVAGYGPGSVPPDADTVRRWAIRAAVVFPSAILAWAMATAVRDRVEPPGLWAAGLAGLLVVIVAANALYVRRPSS